jgi:hypothetical protein
VRNIQPVQTEGVSVTVTEVTTREKARGGWKPGTDYQWTDTNGRTHWNRGRGHRERDERENKTRLYVFPEEWSVLENLIDRESRPTAIYRLALPAVFEKLGIAPVKARWSQYAGCSCPCSPGFVIDARLGYDIFATIKVEGANALVDENKAERAQERYEAVVADPTLVGLTAVR